MMQQDYQLIVIEQEKVPLAATPNVVNSDYWLTFAMMFTAVVLIFLWFYLTRCWSYQKRIRELDPGGTEYRGWNMSQLKRTMEELEFKLAEV